MITINVRGTDFVEKMLREIAPKEALNLTRSTVGAVASEIAKDAKRNMNFSGPHSVGTMRRSTKVRRRRVRAGIVQSDIVVGRQAFYWRFYEYGQGHNPERRMFGQALDKMKPNLANRFEELFMRKLLQRLARIKRQRQGRVR